MYFLFHITMLLQHERRNKIILFLLLRGCLHCLYWYRWTTLAGCLESGLQAQDWTVYVGISQDSRYLIVEMVK